ncbi:Hypothetical protein HVR_LOCUS1267 [uncultured virus]|nr:Hypothetical protein HVR_LOCUS1267 [uncultured virus]
MLATCLNACATKCENRFNETGTLDISAVVVTRYFGQLIPEKEKWNEFSVSENCDYYTILFWKSEDRGFNCCCTIGASRGTKGTQSLSKDCYENKHMRFQYAGRGCNEVPKNQNI